MTNAKLATDEQVARFKVRAVIGALWSDEALSLIARIEADREETARLTSERNALSGINREFAEKIAALKAEAEALRVCLGDVCAMVRGEAPALLDEDRGGDAALSIRIDEALGARRAR